MYLKILALSLLLILVACNKPKDISIIPKPNNIVLNDSQFKLDSNTIVTYDLKNVELSKIANRFNQQIQKSSGLNLLQSKETRSEINLLIDEKLNFGNEGYELIINETNIALKGKSLVGVFYGLQTLIQLISPEVLSETKKLSVPIVIPTLKIIDEPKFTYRGAMLDVGRHYAPKEFVKKFIDILAFHKLNKFHWHLTEDQGWRIEIKKYPKLTDIGSTRIETEGNGSEHKGFYTQEEIKDIIKYAEERFITIIPEIEMPGHSRAVLAAYPNLSCTGIKQKVATTWGVHEDILCAGNEKSFEFLQNVLDEVIELFPGKYIHIGGDEAPKQRWSSCKKCQLRITNEELKDEFELQSYFIKRIEKYLLSKNKYLIGWDEILEGGLAPNATVMSWRGIEGGIKAAQQGHDVIMTPNSHCYFDHYQAQFNEPYAIGGFTSLEKVYSFNPVPDQLSRSEAKHIIGGQANLWTEYIPNTNYAEYMLLPRLSALSEVLWTNSEQKQFNDFERRMINQYSRYGIKKWNYRVPTPKGIDLQKIIYKPTKIKMDIPVPGSIIKYTINGIDPDYNSKTYSDPIEIEKTTLLKVRTIMPDSTMGHVVSSQISFVDSTVNGINYKYYEGQWNKLPNFDNEKPLKSGKVMRFKIDEINSREDHFAILFESKIRIEEEKIIKFHLISDDGSRLIIDSKILIDNDGSHSKKEKTKSVVLTKGTHDIQLQYFEDCEGEDLELYIEGENIPKQEIPASILFLK